MVGCGHDGDPTPRAAPAAHLPLRCRDDRSPREAPAPGLREPVLPRVLRDEGLDQRARRHTGERRARVPRLHRAARHRPAADAAGVLLGRRLAAGVPGRGDPVVQGAPRRRRGGQRRGGARTRSRPRCRSSPTCSRRSASPGSGSPATRPTTSSARSPRASTVPVDVVTGDRDLFQVVDDARGVRVLYTAKGGVARADVIDEAAVRSATASSGASYADFAALRGDPSDGLPGVPGVGREDGGRAHHGLRRPRRRPARGRGRRPRRARDPVHGQDPRGARLPRGRADGRAGRARRPGGPRRRPAAVRARGSRPARELAERWGLTTRRSPASTRPSARPLSRPDAVGSGPQVGASARSDVRSLVGRPSR